MADEGGLIMDDRDTWFLLVQLRRAGRTDVTEFDDPVSACAAYDEAERRYEEKIHNRDVNVLLVGASSLDDVKRGYPSYFLNLKSKAKIIAKLRADLRAMIPA
jgi:hypothetical protein